MGEQKKYRKLLTRIVKESENHKLETVDVINLIEAELKGKVLVTK